MQINKFTIDDNSPVFIIAEAGVNHNGDIKLAKQLVDVAIDAQANCIKFQTFVPELLVSAVAPKAKYQEETTGKDESQLSMLKKLAFGREEFLDLSDYCKSNGIMFFSSPFDEMSLQLLQQLKVDAIKVGSGEITNIWLLESIAKTKLPTIISTGMSDISEIDTALSYFEKDKVALLHCLSSYPAPYDQINLNAIKTLKTVFQVPVGFSDHTLGLEIPIAAVALGAKIIEKHFTLDKSMSGPDHRASLNPGELKEMVTQIRNVENALGDGKKIPRDAELDTRNVARKSLVARIDMKAGEVLTKQNLIAKRPGTGIPIKQFSLLEGKKLKKDIKKDELLSWTHIFPE